MVSRRTLVLVLCSIAATQGLLNTSSWIGSGYYAPAASPDNLSWWSFYSRYRAAVARELPMVKPLLGFNTLRVFLHTLTWESNATALLENIEDFLGLVDAAGLRAGFVLFGSGPQGNASTTTECTPRKGLSNGCWEASPLNVDQTSVDRYRPYVEGIVSAHAADVRVAFWELQNEPPVKNATYWDALRDASFRWARALAPRAPVISCWEDNPDTELVDVHAYSPDFASVWMPRIYANSSKSALVTEGGGRWTEPPAMVVPADYGSPLATLNFLTALRKMASQGAVPFMPGVLFGWEIFCGNSNSRWFWASKENAPEPHIPYLGFLWPDGTPVSYTEAAAFRAYAGTAPVGEVYAFEKWIPARVMDGDRWLTLAPGQAHTAHVLGGRQQLSVSDVVVEAALWFEAGQTAVLAARSHNTSDGSLTQGYAVSVDVDKKTLCVDRVSGGTPTRLGYCFDLAKRENGVGIGCFNLLRVVLQTTANGDTTVSVWLNVLFSDSGFVGNSSDAGRVPHAPAPLLRLVDTAGLPAGGLLVATHGAELRVDYLSALSPTVLSRA